MREKPVSTAWESVLIAVVLAQTRNALDQDVPVRDQGHQQAVDHVGLTHDDLATSVRTRCSRSAWAAISTRSWSLTPGTAGYWAAPSGAPPTGRRERSRGGPQSCRSDPYRSFPGGGRRQGFGPGEGQASDRRTGGPVHAFSNPPPASVLPEPARSPELYPSSGPMTARSAQSGDRRGGVRCRTSDRRRRSSRRGGRSS